MSEIGRAELGKLLDNGTLDLIIEFDDLQDFIDKITSDSYFNSIFIQYP